MQLVDAWKTVVLGNYANFAGRARRPEFWNFFLANLIVSVVLNVLGQAADSPWASVGSTTSASRACGSCSA
jgi:uncharacterized membrane protein YhaH (DUF805 family)